MRKKYNLELLLVLIPIGIGINMGIGEIVYLLKLPIFLDAIGTILITLLIGLWPGIITGVLSFVFLTIFGLNPYTIYFCVTQAMISIFIYYMAKSGLLRKTYFIIITGILLGIIAAIFSAPVKVYLFGGVEGTGSGLIIAYLLNTGKSILNSVFLAGVSVEPIDKTLQLLIAVYIIKGAPKRIILSFTNSILEKNNLI